MDKVIVTLLGLAGILFTYWFFLIKNEETVAVGAGEEIDVVVEGGYKPEAISVKTGVETILNFLRKDQSSCLEEIVIPAFKIRRYLPIGEKVSIAINPVKPGSYGFSCGMNMFHGRIIAT